MRKYFSSADPRARENGVRCSRMVVCGMETGFWRFVMSVIGKCACVRPMRGLRGVRQAKRVRGRGE